MTLVEMDRLVVEKQSVAAVLRSNAAALGIILSYVEMRTTMALRESNAPSEPTLHEPAKKIVELLATGKNLRVILMLNPNLIAGVDEYLRHHIWQAWAEQHQARQVPEPQRDDVEADVVESAVEVEPVAEDTSGEVETPLARGGGDQVPGGEELEAAAALDDEESSAAGVDEAETPEVIQVPEAVVRADVPPPPPPAPPPATAATDPEPPPKRRRRTAKTADSAEAQTPPPPPAEAPFVPVPPAAKAGSAAKKRAVHGPTEPMRSRRLVVPGLEGLFPKP